MFNLTTLEEKMTNQDSKTERNQELSRSLRLMDDIEYIVGKAGQYGGLLTGVDSLINDDPSSALLGLSIYVGGAYLSEFASNAIRENEVLEK